MHTRILLHISLFIDMHACDTYPKRCPYVPIQMSIYTVRMYMYMLTPVVCGKSMILNVSEHATEFFFPYRKKKIIFKNGDIVLSMYVAFHLQHICFYVSQRRQLICSTYCSNSTVVHTLLCSFALLCTALYSFGSSCSFFLWRLFKQWVKVWSTVWGPKEPRLCGEFIQFFEES